MDQAAAERALRKFLLDSQRFQVIAVKGPWGCGKTYLWEKTEKWLRTESSERNAPAPVYCSLFGLDSVSEIRKQLFAQVLDDKAPGSSTVREIATRFGGSLTELLGKVSNTGEALVKLGGVAINAATDAVVDRMLRGRRIVLDDLERRGANLDVISVLGFIHFLRNNGSQVIVLFNDEKIDHEKSLADLMKFREKAFDVELEVRPSVSETYAIARGSARLLSQATHPRFEAILREHYLRFGISNIRVGKRVVNGAMDIFGSHPALPDDIMRETMPVIVAVTGLFYDALLGWPPLSVVEKAIAERGDDRERSSRDDRSRTHLDELLDVYLNDVEAEFFRLVAQHVSTGDLLQNEFHDYWQARLVRRAVDELFEDSNWSPTITGVMVMAQAEKIIVQVDKLDARRLEKLRRVSFNWSLDLDVDATKEALTDADDGDAAANGSENGSHWNGIEISEETSDSIIRLDRAMLDWSRGHYRARQMEVICRASPDMFELLFATQDRNTFRRSVEFLKEWLSEVEEGVDGALGTALRRMSTRTDFDKRLYILHREIVSSELGRESLAGHRLLTLLANLRE